MLKSLLVFSHLLAFALAFSPIVRADWMLFRSRHRPLTDRQLADIRAVERDALLGLAALWITGIALVVLGWSTEGAQYLANEKLWAKVLVAGTMTLNGVVLHGVVFPWLKQGTVFARLPLSRRAVAITLGALSGASWTFAAYLGVARFMNHALPFAHVALLYLGVVAGAIALAHLSQLLPAPAALARADGDQPVAG